MGMAFYNGWKMTLVVLAGLPVIAAANKFQGGSTEETAEPEGIDAVSIALHNVVSRIHPHPIPTNV